MTTLKTIANDLNLSISTVSRILNGKAETFRISESTVSTVLKYAKKVGYTPNLIAKGLQASQTFTIALMVPNIANPFFSQMAMTIEKWASKAHYSIILVNSDESIKKEKQEVERMMGRKVDGIIAAPIGDSFLHFTKIMERNIPLVFVDRYFKDAAIPFITSDNYQGSYDATQQLLSQGHQRIGIIRGNVASELVQERTQGYIDALKNANLPVDDQLLLGSAFTTQNGKDSTKVALKLEHPPTAIFAMNNLIGLGVLQAAKELGITIPETLSVIVFDDLPYFSLLSPSVSSVEQNSEVIGEMAVRAIIKEINNEASITSLKIPTRVILRESIKEVGRAADVIPSKATL